MNSAWKLASCMDSWQNDHYSSVRNSCLKSIILPCSSLKAVMKLINRWRQERATRFVSSWCVWWLYLHLRPDISGQDWLWSWRSVHTLWNTILTSSKSTFWHHSLSHLHFNLYVMISHGKSFCGLQTMPFACPTSWSQRWGTERGNRGWCTVPQSQKRYLRKSLFLPIYFSIDDSS
jgi:hypothetical protein